MTDFVESECLHFVVDVEPVHGGPVTACKKCQQTWGKWMLEHDEPSTSRVQFGAAVISDRTPR